MKTLFLLLIICNLQYFTLSEDASPIIYKSYPKKVHPDREHLKILNAGSFYKKHGKGKSFTRFRPPMSDWLSNKRHNHKEVIAPVGGSLFPADFQGDLKSRVKKVSFFDDKDLRRSKRAANESKPETTTKASTAAATKVETTKAKENKPVTTASPKNVTISRRSASKNVKPPAKARTGAKDVSKRPKPSNVVKLNDPKTSGSRSTKQQEGKNNVNPKRALRKRKTRTRSGKAGKNQPQNVKGGKNFKKPPGRQGGKQAGKQPSKQGKQASKTAPKLRSQAKPKATASRRLIAARDGRPEDYPYMVSIQKDGVHWCSGAILNPQLILSTANCFWKSSAVSRMKVRAGARTIDTGGQTAYIAEVRKHPNWSIRKDPQNDVALALLDRKLKFSDTVHGVDLANVLMKAPFDDVWVTSYGAERRDGVFSRLRMTLQVAYMQYMPDEKCDNITSRFGISLPDDFFCLQQVGRRAPCTRDTGAPAVSDGILWGVASWGIRKLVLLGLPRYCSASAMFAHAHTEGFGAVIRHRVASLMRRVRGSHNTILRTISEKFDCPFLGHWVRTHAHVPGVPEGGRCGTERYPAMFSDLSAPTNLNFLINATTDMMSEQRLSPFLDRLEFRAVQAAPMLEANPRPGGSMSLIQIGDPHQ